MSGVEAPPVRTRHSATVRAPADRVYGLVADVTRWPVLFAPTVCVRRSHHTARDERFTLWALVNDAVLTWTSRREFDPDGQSVAFEQEHSLPPIASMAGRWEFRPTAGDRTEVVLYHAFRTADGSRQAEAKVRRALDTNSTAELAALRRVAELPRDVGDLLFSFTDTVRVPGPVEPVYEFVRAAGRWPDRLPHVRDVRLREAAGGTQFMDMETTTADGGRHTTSSVRVCWPNRRIVYKQTTPPAPLLGHAGEWAFEPGRVTATHQVLLDPAQAIDAHGTLTAAREFVRAALGRNSRATLEHALGQAG